MKLPHNMLDMDRKEFDEHMLKQANAFSVCEYFGSGVYQSQVFVVPDDPPKGLEEARKFKAELLKDRPKAKLMLYGLIVRPSKVEPGYAIDMQIFIE